MFSIKTQNVRIVLFLCLVFLSLSIFLFSYSNYQEYKNLSIDDIQECTIHKSKVDNLLIFEEYKVNRKPFEISVVPNFSNINCLGKVAYIDNFVDDQKELDGFTGKKIVNVYIFTSTNLFLFLIFIFNTFFIFLIQLNRKIKRSILTLFAIFINLFLYYFLEVDFKLSIFVINLIPVLLLIFISVKRESFHNKSLKLNFFQLLTFINILFLPFYFKLFTLQFPIDYYFINYNYGFIRRGFFGTIVFNLAKYNLDLALFFTNAILVSCYIFIIYESINYLFLNSDKKNLFLIFSPVFLLYPLNQMYRFNSDIANPELFGICLMFYFFRVKQHNEKKYFFIFLLLFIFSILTHEINLFIIPFIFLYYLFEKKDIWEFALILLVAFVFLFIYFYIPIDNNNVDQICDDLINLNIRENICENAIVNLNINYSSNDPLEILLKNFSFNIFTASNLTPLSYVISIIFGFLPIYFYDSSKIEKILFVLILLSFFPTLLYATDWGRWLYLYFSCLYIFIIRNNTKKRFVSGKTIEIGYGLLVLLIFFIFFWYNKSCCSNEVFKLTNVIKTNMFLYFVFFNQLLKYFKKYVIK